MENENDSLLEGMKYAMLMLAGVGNNKLNRLIYHKARDIAGDTMTVIYLYRTNKDGFVAIGDLEFKHGGKFMRPDIEFLEKAAAKLKLIKET